MSKVAGLFASVVPDPEPAAARLTPRICGRITQASPSTIILKEEPCEQYGISKHHERADCGKRIADFMASVHKRHADGRHEGAEDPNPDLWDGQPVRFDLGVQTIKDSEQEQCDKAEKVEMRVSRVSGMIISHGHLQAPEHATATTTLRL
jgi:hypothetical protein